MNEDDRAELSAYLDAEVDPDRARHIEALIVSDPDFRAEFERLKLADESLRSIADASAFRPEVRWPQAARPAGAWLAAPLCLILLGWVVGKLSVTMTMALGVNAATLLLLLACLAPFALREARMAERAIR